MTSQPDSPWNDHRTHVAVNKAMARAAAKEQEVSGGTLAVSWGSYGGFYLYRDFSWRLCLGWLAVTFMPVDLDDVLKDAYGGTRFDQ